MITKTEQTWVWRAGRARPQSIHKDNVQDGEKTFSTELEAFTTFRDRQLELASRCNEAASEADREILKLKGEG